MIYQRNIPEKNSAAQQLGISGMILSNPGNDAIYKHANMIMIVILYKREKEIVC